MDTSVLSAANPAIKHDQHSSIPRQLDDVHCGLLKALPDRLSIDLALTP
ncbi:hypothetical protein [Trinickia violacea]|nr:hypothetical protein [Trinickia violacea]